MSRPKKVVPVAEATQEPVTPPVAVEEKPEQIISVLSERDALIREMQKSEPKSLEDIDSRPITVNPLSTRSRMALPEYFEPFSYDCSWGDGCKHHPRKFQYNGPRMEMVYLKRGKYIFRYCFKDRRALDRARNVNGWHFVNRSLFKDAPKELFTASGGVETGDAVLMFMPAKQALEIRTAPSKRSQELLRSRITPSKKEGKALMTGNPEDPRFYEPQGGVEDDGQSDEAPAGALQEGRDFDDKGFLNRSNS